MSRTGTPLPRGALAGLVAALVLLAVGASACGNTAHSQKPEQPVRAVGFARCPEISLSSEPRGFELSERRLEALSGNRMGKVVTYRDGKRTIQLYSGPDLYDRLEDLDLTAQEMSTEEHSFTVSTTLLAPELIIAVLDDDQLDKASCDDIGVLSRHVPMPVLLRVLDNVRVDLTP